MSASATMLVRCVTVFLSLVSLALPAMAQHPAAFSLAQLSVGQFSSGNESPAREECDALLERGRAALEQGNYAQAQYCLEQAEQLNVTYDSLFARFSDSPQKLRGDLEAATGRSSQSQTPSSRFQPQAGRGEQTSTAPADPFQGATPARSTEQTLDTMTSGAKAQAQQFLQNARTALSAGHNFEAVGWYHKAVATGAQFGPQEYSPQHLAADLQARGVSLDQHAASTTAPRDLAPSDVPPSRGEVLAERITGYGSTPQSATTEITDPNSIGQGGQSDLVRMPSAPQQGDSPSAAQLLLAARRAIAAGDGEAARGFIEQTRSLGLTYAQGEDSPERVDGLMGEWRQLVVAAQQGPATQQLLRRHSDFFMEQARWLLHHGDREAAHSMATRAAELRADYSQFESTPAQFLADLEQQATSASPVAAAGSDDAHRLSELVDQARQAMEMGDQARAESLVAQAEVIKARLEGGVAPASYSPEYPSTGQGVVPAGGDLPAAQSYPVAQSVYSPSQDTSEVVQAQSNGSSRRGGEPSAAERSVAQNSADPYTLITQGEQALRQGDVATAREYFQRAWQFQAELDPAARQHVQNFLQDLPVPGEVVPTGPEITSALDQLTAEQQLLLRRFQQDLSQTRAAVERRRQVDPLGSHKLLVELHERISQSELDAGARGTLLHSLDLSIAEMNQYIDSRRAEIELDEANAAVLAELDANRQRREEIDILLVDLVEQFNQLSREQRYEEAVTVARRAHEIDPDNPVTELLYQRGQMAARVAEMERIEAAREAGTWDALTDVDRSAIPIVGDIVYPDAQDWVRMTDDRLRFGDDARHQMTPAERQLTAALNQPVPVNFEEVPLAQAMQYLAQIANVNIHIDPVGLAAEGVSTNEPVSLQLGDKEIMLQSVLNLLLGPKRLSYVIQDEVLLITSEQVRDVKIQTRVYKVADLVIPIPNFSPGQNMGLSGALKSAIETANQGQINFQGMPPAMMADAGMPAPSSALANYNPLGPPDMMGYGPGGMGGGAEADFESLIDLITSTIAPTTWDEVGGVGSIAGFETNLSLVVSQTQEVHEQIVDLLEQLRRLQDLQVTIEVRFIRLRDFFFERIGVDFDFNIESNSGLTAAQFQALPDPPSATVGITPDMNGNPALTADLSIPYTSSLFGSAVPRFGGFNPTSTASFGFAILSDIEAFFLIQAAQGDMRDNVLQAPKVTLFNGQQASVSDTQQQSFVTSLIPVVGDFAAIHQPVIVVLSEGMQLSVQAVVSPDRRYVRLTLVPFFSQIGDVNTFTFQGTSSTNSGTTALDPADDTQTVVDDATSQNSGTTVQLPEFAYTTVTTTVSVPDGGTILLGGIKRLSENRDETGVPILSKVPYVNRLFRNVGIGRQTESLMMMVTPRIIIQEEEEELLFGTQQ